MKQTKLLIIAIAPIVLGFCLSRVGNNSHEVEPRSEALAQQPKGEMISTITALTRTLNNAGMPGGIAVTVGCEEDPRFMFPPPKSDFEDSLNLIVSVDPQFRWSSDDGLINVSPKSGDPPLLAVRLAKVKIRNAPSLNEVVNRLLSLSAVQRRIAELHLNSAPARTGIGDLKRPSATPKDRTKYYSLELKNVTLREALNALVRKQGAVVWEYRERRCDGKAEFGIQLVVT